jgi:hypothetical protein
MLYGGRDPVPVSLHDFAANDTLADATVAGLRFATRPSDFCACTLRCFLLAAWPGAS